jgi:hypothetical protein
MSNKTKVTYSPDFSYKKSYETIGNKELSDQDIQDIIIPDSDAQLINIDSIVSDVTSIINSSRILPSSISTIIVSMLTGILDSLDKIDNNNLPGTSSDNKAPGVNNIPNQDASSTSNTESIRIEISDSEPKTSKHRKISSDPKYYKYQNENGDFYGNKFGKQITLPKKLHKKVKINNQYKHPDENKYDLVDAFDYSVLIVYRDFLERLKSAIVNYTMGLYEGSSYGNIYDTKNKHEKHTNSVDQNIKHLNDNIIRSEIVLDQKLRLAKKLFTVNNCHSHFNSLYVSKELYNRYKIEKHQLENNTKCNYINQSLDATKSIYYGKYASNLTNMYKYYNSCGVILSECLDTIAQSFVSKNIIG